MIFYFSVSSVLLLLFFAELATADKDKVNEHSVQLALLAVLWGPALLALMGVLLWTAMREKLRKS